MILDIDNQTDLLLDTEQLEAIATEMTTQPVELIVVDNAAIQLLNKTHRHKDAPTDVLSFPMDASFTETSLFGLPLGSIVISADYTRQKAAMYGHTPEDEFALLFIHGLLHLLGYDHENDQGEMRAKEHQLIKRWDLPASLIVRTEEL
jgi:probable rRNA maturation factor